MLYNQEALPHYVRTAGKISILASIVGVCVFLFALMVDVGQQELQRVSAQQTATTSLTVLNTPPFFLELPFEVVGSTTTNPTNSGSDIVFRATAEDANEADYYLLICSTNASPTANSSAPPECGAGAIQWAVSAPASSTVPVTVATTTVEGGLFAEENEWYAWVCDADDTQPECSETPEQGSLGPTASSSSPFNMNRRPVLVTASGSPSGTNPGELLTFFSSSSDPDSVGGEDEIRLIICNDAAFSTTTDTCGDGRASSTNPSLVTNDVTATTSLPAVIRDQSYAVFAHLVDEHGHNASTILNTSFIVNNVSPTLLGGQITLNGGSDILVTNPGGEQSGLTLDFTVDDANSCQNTTGTPGSEFSSYQVSLYHTNYATSTDCDPNNPGDYDPNYCYINNGSPTTQWNLACTASTTTCESESDPSMLYECTFPLWFVADPTDANSVFEAEEWVAAVASVDDDGATSTQVRSAGGVEVLSLAALNLLDASIPYGPLAPGDQGALNAATTTEVENIGNTGLNKGIEGSAMCPTYVSSSTDCSLSGAATSTIFSFFQQYATSAQAYNGPSTFALATTGSQVLPPELDIRILKTTGTSTPDFATGETFWGIEVPSSISLAGSYQGQNAFYAEVSASSTW